MSGLQVDKSLHRERTETIPIISHIHAQNLNWALQIMQNILAICSMISLKIFDREKAKASWEEFQEMFHLDEKKIENFVKKPKEEWNHLGIDDEAIKKYFSARKKRPWITASSYPFPFWKELKRSDRFCFLEECFFYYWLGRGENEPNETQVIFDKRILLGCSKLSLTDHDWYLITGPVFTKIENPSGEEINKEITKLIDDYIPFFWPDQKPIEKDEQRHLLKLQTTLRFFWEVKPFKNRLHKMTNILESLLHAEWPNGSILRRCLCRSLARQTWVLHSKTMEEILKECLNPSSQNISEGNIVIKLPLLSRDIHQLIAEKSDESWRLVIKKEVNSLPQVLFTPDLYGIKPNEEFVKVQEFTQERMEHLSRETDLRITSFESAYMQELMVSLLNWFRKKYGLLAARTQEGDPLKEICDNICREIVSFLTADHCTIYQYEYDSEKLVVEGSYSRINKNELQQMYIEIEKLGSDSDRAKKSIVYRCLHDGQAHFCRSVIKLTDGSYEFDPEDENILIAPDLGIRSAVAAPLQIHGRILGVIEVGGFSPYQFRWENMQAISRIDEIVTPLLYETLIFHSVKELTRITLSTEKNDEKKYMDICERLRSLFMAYTAVLWLPNPYETNLFYPVGWTRNRDDLASKIKDIDQVSYDRNEQDSLYCRAFRNDCKKPIGTINIPDENLPDIWFDYKEYRKWLKEKGIEDVSIIPVYGSNKFDRTSQDTPLLIISFYFKNRGEGLQSAWTPEINFMANQVALLVEALMSQREMENALGNVISHDLKQNINNILSRADDIYEFVQENSSREFIEKKYIGKPGLRAPLSKAFLDIRSYGNNLEYLLKKFEDPNIFRTTAHLMPKISPLHYLVLKEVENTTLSGKTIPEIRISGTLISLLVAKRRELNERGLRYDIDDVDRNLMIRILPEHLERIFSNLVENALKYALPKTIITITTEEKPENNLIRIKISNYARRLEQPKIEKYTIFKQGYQGSNVLKGSTKGKGIGLYIVRIYCEAYEGSIKLRLEEENPSENTALFTFEITFPRKIYLKQGAFL